MGCCSSTRNIQYESSEEETVKEVTSEDTKSMSDQIPRLERELSRRVTLPDGDIMTRTRKQEEIVVNCTCNLPPPMVEDHEVSDVSGFSRNASIVAAEIPEKGEVLRRSSSMKSPAKFRSNAITGEVKERNMTVQKSPSRRFEPSPLRRSEPSPGRGRQNLRQRREFGETSGRRSNSPANRMVENGSGSGKAVLGRSGSGRRTGPSPARVRPDQYAGRIRKVDDVTDKEESWLTGTAMQPTATAPSKEAPENPSMALECFVFL